MQLGSSCTKGRLLGILPHARLVAFGKLTMAISSSVQASHALIMQGPEGTRTRRRFAPLDTCKSGSSDETRLRGIVFDVDGTLCLPQNHMFREMRSVLNIPKTVDILEHIQSLSPVSDTPANSSEPATSPRDRAMEAIRTIELTAMTEQEPQPGLTELMSYLHQKTIDPETNLKVALCTRNFPGPVDHLLETFLPAEQRDMLNPIITRETTGIRAKPSPEGLWHIAEQWGLVNELDPEEVISQGDSKDILQIGRQFLGRGMIMVGDSIDDMTAGHRAGAATVLLANEDNMHLKSHEHTDLSIDRLDELIEILRKGFVGREQ